MENKGNFFAKTISGLQPWQRLAVSCVGAAITYVLLRYSVNPLNRYFVLLITWDVFAVVYLICCWVVLINLKLPVLKQNASQEDGSKWMVFVLVILFSIAGLFIIMLLLSKNIVDVPRLPVTLGAVAGMFFPGLLCILFFLFIMPICIIKIIVKVAAWLFPAIMSPIILTLHIFP